MKREYRVVWEREPHIDAHSGITYGGHRRSALYQSVDAARRKALLLQGRLCDALGVDPDEPWCCGGSWDCPCEGLTWSGREEEYRGREGMRQPLRLLRIDMREVGPWHDGWVVKDGAGFDSDEPVRGAA